MEANEADLRLELVKWARSLFDRGFTVGSSGNISVKLGDGFLCTPTNSCLGFLEPENLSRLDRQGSHIDGPLPTKELPLHMAFYRGRSRASAVVHLHSTFATAISCLQDVDKNDAIAPITPYVAMRVGTVPVLPYTAPGSTEVAALVREKAATHAAVLLANHGPVVAGTSLASAVFAAEELEETAKLIILTREMKIERLPRAELDRLSALYDLK